MSDKTTRFPEWTPTAAFHVWSAGARMALCECSNHLLSKSKINNNRLLISLCIHSIQKLIDSHLFAKLHNPRRATNMYVSLPSLVYFVLDIWHSGMESNCIRQFRLCQYDWPPPPLSHLSDQTPSYLERLVYSEHPPQQYVCDTANGCLMSFRWNSTFDKWRFHFSTLSWLCVHGMCPNYSDIEWFMLIIFLW